MEIGRKSLPHGVPLHIDPRQELYFVSICCQQRTGEPLLQDNVPEKVIAAIDYNNQQGKWWVYLAVVMPDHLHFLVRFPGGLADAVKNWKHWTSRNLKIHWQRDHFEHRLRQEESYQEKAAYVLNNPVRAGLVSRWQDWPHIFISGELPTFRG